MEVFCTSFRNLDHGFWQLLEIPFGDSVTRKGMRTMAVKSVASEKRGSCLNSCFRRLCNTSKAPVVAQRACAHTAHALQACVTGCVLSLARAWHSGWRLGLKRLEILFGEYYGFSLLGIFTLCFEKTGVKKSYVSVLSRVRLFATLWTVPARLPCAWDLPGQNAGVGCHFLLQGIFPTQGANLHHLHRKQILYHWATCEAQCILLWKAGVSGETITDLLKQFCQFGYIVCGPLLWTIWNTKQK